MWGCCDIFTMATGLHEWIKTFSHSPAPIKRHLSLVKLGPLVWLVLNLAFYFFHFSKNLEGGWQINVPDPNALTTHCPDPTPCFSFFFFFHSFVPLQPQHTQTPLSFSLLNAVLDNGQFTWGRKTWMKWNMTGECAEFKYKYTSGHILMPNKLSALLIVFM